MVAHLLRLRLLVLKNSLLRSPWQLVAVIIGGLYGLGLLLFAVIGLFTLSGAPIELSRTIVILAGSAAVLGWIIIPLIASGVDQTLDPARLVTFPIPFNQLLLGLAVSGVLGVPGIVTLLAALATAGTWWRHPVIALVAMLCGVIGTLTCVIGARMVTTLSSSFSSGRRFREIGSIILFIPLVLLGPIIISVTSGIRNVADALPGFAGALSWTPLGAIWAVPSEIARGSYGPAAIKFLIGIVVLLAVALLWRRSLAIALVKPAHTASKQRARGKLGLLGLVPDRPWGAVAARSLTYWVRDPRYARQLLIVPVVPVLMYFYSHNEQSLGVLVAMAPIVALFLSLSIFTDLSYDGTAFATHVASGIRGADDRIGRVVALATFSLPIVVIFSIASVWAADLWRLLPALLGLSLGTLLTGFGISSFSSAIVAVPVPAPGDNPFKSPPGAGFTTTLTTFATWGILAVLVIPEVVLLIVTAATQQALIGWIGLVVGVVLGSVLMVVGIRLGGRRLDLGSSEMLVRLQRQR
ncbi:transporter [Glaciihabitans sp. UYNi722]|uniref:transporter n=1 Tax=Glaciihabitans sp. UYNi722 TaxID=3156344 RepID=UPI0033985E19